MQTIEYRGVDHLIRLDLTPDELTSLVAHFGIAINLRMGRMGAHHHLMAQRVPKAVQDSLTAKLIEAMKELEVAMAAGIKE